MRKKLVKRRKKRAMSLAEILVAIFISSLLLTTIVGIFYYSNKASVSGFEKAEAEQSFNNTIDYITRDLHSTGSNVSVLTCGIPKELSIERVTQKSMIVYGDFDEDSNTVEKVEYVLVNNDTCLVRRLFTQQGTGPGSTWVNPSEKVLIGNRDSDNKGSKIKIGTNGIRFTYYDYRGNPLGVPLSYDQYNKEEIFISNNYEYIIPPAYAIGGLPTATPPPPTVTPVPPTSTPKPPTPVPPTSTPTLTSANLTATAAPKQTATKAAQQTAAPKQTATAAAQQTAAPQQTATKAAQRTATAIAQQTAAPIQTATKAAKQTATAIANQTAAPQQTATKAAQQTAAPQQTATKAAQQTATAIINQTAAPQQTATKAAQQTAAAPTITPTPSQTTAPVPPTPTQSTNVERLVRGVGITIQIDNMKGAHVKQQSSTNITIKNLFLEGENQ